MPPENLRAIFGERLKALETEHIAMQREHVMSVSALSDRLEAHIEETERQFSAVNATVSSTQVGIDALTSTVGKFISAHEAIETTKDKQSIKSWQLWGLVAAVFVSPFVSKIIDSVFGG